MASFTIGVKRVRSGQQVVITGFLMALTAVVGLIIINVMMAVQTVQTIGICVREVGEQYFAGLVLKHESHRVLRGWDEKDA